MLLLCLCKGIYTVARVCIFPYVCIIYTSPAIFRLYSVCAYDQYRTTSLLETSIGRSWQYRYDQDVSFYSGSTRPKCVGGMPLEVYFTHTYLSSLYHSRDVLDQALPSFSGRSKVIHRESLGTRLSIAIQVVKGVTAFKHLCFFVLGRRLLTSIYMLVSSAILVCAVSM